ncbi:calcium uptake protein 3, mitochondrial isoform X2 [Lingula anatina]|uniref:Calcium uptake protein 3, mitochondrial isoform X2 n=1 Tax=Lingula anatina TaxID=7574 RepID=A0A1S3JQY9_LINAN|nr:calcium uptake protein 3, mitochondrial isoform X2 [Lingula anatina]|eukprot:XP_013412772.1 calcium uptake protein 3, mitochondrial isoform X2 [Lingula anatina]
MKNAPLNKTRTIAALTLAVSGGATFCYLCRQRQKFTFNVIPTAYAQTQPQEQIVKNWFLWKLLQEDQQDLDGAQQPMSYREERFLSFASLEYAGKIYMTPQDFLESVIQEEPRDRVRRRYLRDIEVKKWLTDTPTRHKGSIELFRAIHDKGLISYTEYLFLLCVLTKPKSGFHIAFNMFDTDGNQQVDKQEFLVLANVFASPSHVDSVEHSQRPFAVIKGENTAGSMEVPYDDLETDPRPKRKPMNIWQLKGDREGVEDIALYADTTLLVHFFGQKGKENLSFQDFARFMENLQTEVLELEFEEYARGMPTISEEDFARVLLHYTQLNQADCEEYIERLKERRPEEKGIVFKDFRDFFQFLNHLDDFSMAMKLYTVANQPVSQELFHRAVMVCTGLKLNPHVIDTVFQLFDIDGDGQLSHQEFISIMKSRLHRGFRSHLVKMNRWDSFKACLKEEMKTK